MALAFFAGRSLAMRAEEDAAVEEVVDNTDVEAPHEGGSAEAAVAVSRRGCCEQ